MANYFTLARILLMLPIAWAILSGHNALAFWLFLLAGFTDLVDGALARALGDADDLGAALDPIADKILTLGTLLALSVTAHITGIHLLAALLILMREFWVGGLREALAGHGKLAVISLAKWKTGLQLFALTLLILTSDWTHFLGLILLWGAGLLTLWTGWLYTLAGWPILKARSAQPSPTKL